MWAVMRPFCVSVGDGQEYRFFQIVGGQQFMGMTGSAACERKGELMKEKIKLSPRRLGIIVLLVVALISMFFSPIASSPEFHESTIASLNEKKITVTELTAATALASVAIAAVPGDSTTPISTQISELSTKLLLVISAIMLEKSLVCVLGWVTFLWMIPLACVLGILYLFKKTKILLKLAISFGILGIVMFLLIPTSVKIGNYIDETFQVNQTIEAAKQAAGEIGENEDEDEEEEKGEKGLGDRLADFGNNLVSGLTSSFGSMENALGNLMDAIAALLITSCAIPVLVLLIFVWVFKIVIDNLK